MRGFIAIGISMLVLIAVWQVVIWATGVPRFILPQPLSTATALWDYRALLSEHALVTIAETLFGFALGALIGGLTAVQLAGSQWAALHIRPVLVFTQAVPVFALAPILTLWFGYGMAPKIMMALLITYFPVTSAFYDGLIRTPPGMLDLARTMRASPWRVMMQVRVPAAMPALMSGLRLAAVYAPIGAVIGEWVGASRGLGYLMLRANGEVKTDLMFATVIVLAAFTVLLHTGVDRAAKRVTEWYT